MPSAPPLFSTPSSLKLRFPTLKGILPRERPVSMGNPAAAIIAMTCFSCGIRARPRCCRLAWRATRIVSPVSSGNLGCAVLVSFGSYRVLKVTADAGATRPFLLRPAAHDRESASTCAEEISPSDESADDFSHKQRRPGCCLWGENVEPGGSGSPFVSARTCPVLNESHLSGRADTISVRHNPGADHAGVERLSSRPRHAQKKPARAWSDTDTRAGPADAKSLSGTRAPLGHQNQPPDGSRPLRRRYVTRLP